MWVAWIYAIGGHGADKSRMAKVGGCKRCNKKNVTPFQECAKCQMEFWPET
jgi:hypothetical protein